MKHGVASQAAHQMELVGQDKVDKCLLREGRIADNVAGDALEFVLVVLEHLGIPLVERHLILLTAFLQRRLYGAEHHEIMKVDIDEAYAQNLQPVLDRTCASGPERTYMWSSLSRLGNIAGIYGDAHPPGATTEVEGTHPQVELHPVHITVECLTVALLRTCSVASELEKIYL